MNKHIVKHIVKGWLVGEKFVETNISLSYAGGDSIAVWVSYTRLSPD